MELPRRSLKEEPVVGVLVSHERDAEAAVSEIVEAIEPRNTCFVLVFPPEGMDHDALAAALDRLLPGVPAFGCTTAGQITPQGYETEALLVLQFPKAHFRCASLLISPLKPLSMKEVSESARRMAVRFQRTAQWNRLALTFADGLSKQEDMLAAVLATALDDMPVFGGSAGDGMQFQNTRILHNGRFHDNAALLLLLETDLEFTGLGFDHFQPSEKRMVVTAAEPEERLVMEMNGASAAKEYARLVGCREDELSPRIFAENPVLVRNNALFHVRAIQNVKEDGALSFLSAIEDGLLLTLGQGKEILRTLEAGLDVRDAQGNRPDIILGFDCVLRKLEMVEKQMAPRASEILRNARVVGFNTYGEQHCGVHVNQTFVGVAFFRPRRQALH